MHDTHLFDRTVARVLLVHVITRELCMQVAIKYRYLERLDRSL